MDKQPAEDAGPLAVASGEQSGGSAATADGSLPLYRQVYLALKEDIAHGRLVPGNRIPSEGQLCERFKVSRITTRKALADLAEEGLVVKRRGKGTYVSAQVLREVPVNSGSFIAMCHKQGIEPKTIVIASERRHPTSLEREQFGGADLEWVLAITRLRTAAGAPCILEVDVFRESIGPILTSDVENVPLATTIHELTGLEVGSRIDTFSIEGAKKRDADWLGCQVGTPLLIVDQVVLDCAKAPLYLNQQRIDTTSYKYVVTH